MSFSVNILLHIPCFLSYPDFIIMVSYISGSDNIQHSSVLPFPDNVNIFFSKGKDLKLHFLSVWISGKWVVSTVRDKCCVSQHKAWRGLLRAATGTDLDRWQWIKENGCLLWSEVIFWTFWMCCSFCHHWADELRSNLQRVNCVSCMDTWQHPADTQPSSFSLLDEQRCMFTSRSAAPVHLINPCSHTASP